MATIESVDLFYLRMPDVQDIGDGSQDALLVRVRDGRHEGWGECEASPLTSMASFVAPMSHSACKPLSSVVIGSPIDDPDDIRAIAQKVKASCLDLPQADHMWAGIDMALWDLLGRRLSEPVYRLLGYQRAYPKEPYASNLFGDTPEATRRTAVRLRTEGFQSVKFGWGPFGRRTLAEDKAQLEAAREGLTGDLRLMVDAGTVWNDDVEAAELRLPSLESVDAFWLEEPFHGAEIGAYAALAGRTKVSLAGGEGSSNAAQARQLIDFGRIGTVQIDAGRCGISSAHAVAQHADRAGVKFVNHTFTSSLSLAASVSAYAGLEAHTLCEFPVSPKPVARDLTTVRIILGRDGLVRVPEGPGLGIEVDQAHIDKYLVDVELKFARRTIFRSDRWVLRNG
jgi:L-alanine-DL-glutamate epimerase-like enolase superfamily enzyme